MIYRKEHDVEPKELPESWKESVMELLGSVYKAELEMRNKIFFLHGVSFPTELFIAISLLDPHDEVAIPTTYQMSADLDENTKSETLLKTMVDSIGIFFDNFFASEDWDDYQANWEEIEIQKTKFHYRVCRENLKLTLEADRLLRVH